MDPVIIRRIFPCAKRQLFDAWSKPSLMMRWFFKGQQPNAPSTVNSSFTVGGHYEVIMHLESGDYRHYGVYQAINRYNHIAFSWNSHLVQNSAVILDFRELSANRTELILTHRLFPDDDVRSKHIEGWQGCMDNLELMLAVPAPPDKGPM